MRWSRDGVCSPRLHVSRRFLHENPCPREFGRTAVSLLDHTATGANVVSRPGRFRRARGRLALSAGDGRNGVPRHREQAMTRSIVPALVAAIVTSGCAQFSADGGMSQVASGVAREAGLDAGKSVVKIASAEQAQRTKEQVAVLLAGPLTTDTAVQVALLNNRN